MARDKDLILTTMGKHDNLDLLAEAELNRGDLDTRMDDDRDLFNLDDYKMTDDNDDEVPDVINVTLNDARVFVKKTMSIISGAIMQPVVKGKEMTDEEHATVEGFLTDMFTAIDERLSNFEIPSLMSWLIQHVCLRYAIGGRVLLYEDNDVFVPDIQPVDMRYTYCGYDDKGLAWVASKSTVPKLHAKLLYPEAAILGDIAGRVEFWNREYQQIFLDEAKVDEAENKLGYVPYVIQKAVSGTFLQDDNKQSFEGESLYESTRKLYPEMNRSASILQTLNMMTFAGGHQYESEAGEEAAKPEDAVQGFFKVIPVPKGGGYKLIPINDAKNAARLLHALLSVALQRGSIPNIDYGNLTFPLSAVAIKRLMAARDDVLIPRLDTLGIWYRNVARMIIKQYCEGGFKAELGAQGLEREYEASDLKDKKYSIEYRFLSQNPEQHVANYAIAQQAIATGFPRRYVWDKVMGVENPHELMIEADSERAARSSIAQTLFDQAHSLVNMAEKTSDENYYVKAELTLQDLELVLDQRAQGVPAGLPQPTSGGGELSQTKPLVPLFEQGGGGKKQPLAEEEEELETPIELQTNMERRAETVRRSSEVE